MIKVEPCRGCGQILMLDEIAPGLTVRVDTEPLDAQTAVQALVDGRELWTRKIDRTNTVVGLRGATPGHLSALHAEVRPTVYRQHRCTVSAQEALSRPRTPSLRSSVQPPSPEPSVGRTAPSSGPQTGSSSVRSAVKPRSEGPRCDACGEPMADGTYASIELGELMIWAQHIDTCGG